MSSRHSLPKRAGACALATLLIWADIAHVAQANTDIADIPMATRGRAKPNLIMAVDDSGSMDGEFSPVRGFSTNDGAAWWNTALDTFVGCGYEAEQANACTRPTADANGAPLVQASQVNFNIQGNANSTWKKYTYLFPNGQCGANCDTRSYADAGNDHFAIPPTREFAFFRSPVFNAQYYNPAINYDPWRPYNNGTTTITPPSYDNGGTGRNWNAVRSHPVYPTSGTATTIDVANTVAQPGDSNATNRTFRMYGGMILPANARYRSCTSADNSSCGPWTNNTAQDRCIRSNASVGCINAAWAIPGYVYNASGSASDTYNLGIGTADHLDVQIAYYPATVWVVSTGTGALAADEAWGPILPGASAPTRLRRIEIRSTTTSYPKAVTRDDCAGTTCTYQEEMTNFANWYAYYRKRHLYLNAATGLAFDQVRGIRVGAFLFNNRTDVTMYDFDSTSDTQNARRLLNQLYRVKGNGGTPTRRALEHAGTQYRRTGSGAPITAACQYNAGFVITDGFASTEAPSTNYGNADNNPSNRFTIPYSESNPDLRMTTDSPPGNIPPPPGVPPAVTVTPTAPYADNFSNTLGDVAMHFYSTNLRPDLTPIRQVPIDINDTAPDADRQDYLHMTTFALGLGVQGFIFGRSDTQALIDTNRDPYNFPPDWNALGNPLTSQRGPINIDELWHATINGRGMMLSASAPEEARNGVVDVVNSVGAKGGSGAAVAVANPNLAPGDNYSYASTYNSGAWSGDINRYAIDLTTGIVSAVPGWNPSPQKQLATRRPDTRLIATFDGTAAAPFRWTNLSSAQKTALNNDPEILDYLRGARNKEVTKFRSRGPRPQTDASGNYVTDASGNYVYANNLTPNNISVLGDIVNAEPVVVAAPVFNYFDNGYSAFRAAQASRGTVVYQGANDGMLHAFSGVDGSELWAYVPSFVYPNLRNLSDRNAFTHKYYVDGTPTVGDVDINYTAGFSLASPPAPDWRTILVGGLRKGGFGFYALDVTSPAAGDETQVAQKVLWEFPNATTPSATRANIGFSYTRPIIAKTRAAGWVVIVSSGYNNGTTGASGYSGGDGVGRIWVLNARTGDIIRELSTGVGTTTNASGLAQLAAFAERPQVDPTIEAVYGGDLLGNLWRFDLSATDVSSWSVTRVATLTDASGNIAPITTEPELGVVNRERFIYVGTGQYLGDSDIPNNTPENVYARRRMSFFAVKDTPTVFTSPVIASPVRSTMVQQTITKSATTATLTANPVPSSASGWYIDFPDDGERSVTNPVLSGGVLVFTSNTPIGGNAAQCIPGGSSWVWFVDYATGGRITLAGSPAFSGQFVGNVLSSRPVLVRLPDGNIVGLVRGSDSQTRTIDPPNNTAATTGRRLSWREIVQ
jgi:type IV pilus assembly protein PilY1